MCLEGVELVDAPRGGDGPGGLPGLLGKRRVAVHELPPEPERKAAADRRLADAHQPDDDDVTDRHDSTLRCKST